MIILVQLLENKDLLILDSLGRLQITSRSKLNEPKFKFAPFLLLNPLSLLEQAIFFQKKSILLAKSKSKLFTYKINLESNLQSSSISFLNEQIIHFTPQVDIESLNDSGSLIYSSCDFLCNRAKFIESSKTSSGFRRQGARKTNLIRQKIVWKSNKIWNLKTKSST